MIIRFVVSNFLSFKDETEFNMLTGNFKIHKDHIYNVHGIEVLKGAAIYGANGAGKSNLIKAIDFLRTLVTNGKVDSIPTKHKVSSGNLEKPTTFELEFSTRDSIYSYGLTIDHTSIVEEWLVKVLSDKNEEIIFERSIVNGHQSIRLNDRYLVSEQDRLRLNLFSQELVSENDLFLSFVAKLKENIIKEITEAHEWIDKRIVIIFPNSHPAHLIPKFISHKDFRDFSSEILCSFATGITRIDAETIPLDKFFGEDDKAQVREITEKLRGGKPIALFSPGNDIVIATIEEGKPVIKKLYTWHSGDKGQEVKFGLEEESDGTQRLFDFIPAIYALLFDNTSVFIDEIDQSIHANLLKSLVSKIMNEKKMNGQLIFTTHESNLLDLEIFRQDEIWFAEKNKTGETHLYSMSEYKPRYDLDVRKGYLNGRFDAIPFLANLADLNWDMYAKEEQGV